MGKKHLYYYHGGFFRGNSTSYRKHEQIPEVYFFIDHYGDNIVTFGNFNGIRTYQYLYINKEDKECGIN
jgi:hypothetical protein